MRIKTFLRFVSLLKNLHGIHQQKNIQKERLIFRSSRSDQCPCHRSKETSIYQHGYLFSLDYDATNVMDNDNLATALSAKIQIYIALIGMVRKPSVVLIVLAK